MTKAEKAHLSAVQELGCIACRVIGYVDTPAEIHHVRHGQGASQRADHFHVLPLCPIHHRNGNHGVAFHAGKQTWQARFGTELDLLARVKSLLEDEV